MCSVAERIPLKTSYTQKKLAMPCLKLKLKSRLFLSPTSVANCRRHTHFLNLFYQECLSAASTCIPLIERKKAASWVRVYAFKPGIMTGDSREGKWKVKPACTNVGNSNLYLVTERGSRCRKHTHTHIALVCIMEVGGSCVLLYDENDSKE